MSISGVVQGAFTYAYRISFYSVSISASQSATPAPSETPNPAPTLPVSRDQFRNDLTTLFQAVKSGDMTAARQALETVQADRPELFDTSITATGRRAALQSDFQSLVNAVQSGDASSAEGALARPQSDVKVGHGHHHPHRHHPDDGSRSAIPPVASGPAPGASPAFSGTAATGGEKDGDGDSH